MRRSKRIETLDQRPVNLDGYINEWPEMGFVAMTSPYDPKPSVKVANGRIVELDGKKREDFDFIDQFLYHFVIATPEHVPPAFGIQIPSLPYTKIVSLQYDFSHKSCKESSNMGLWTYLPSTL